MNKYERLRRAVLLNDEKIVITSRQHSNFDSKKTHEPERVFATENGVSITFDSRTGREFRVVIPSEIVKDMAALVSFAQLEDKVKAQVRAEAEAEAAE